MCFTQHDTPPFAHRTEHSDPTLKPTPFPCIKQNQNAAPRLDSSLCWRTFLYFLFPGLPWTSRAEGWFFISWPLWLFISSGKTSGLTELLWLLKTTRCACHLGEGDPGETGCYWGSGLFPPMPSAQASWTPEQTSTRPSSSALSLWFNQGEGIWGMLAFLLLIIPLVRKWQERGRLITESLLPQLQWESGPAQRCCQPAMEQLPWEARRGQGLLRGVQSNRAEASQLGPARATAIPLRRGQGPRASFSPHPIPHLLISPPHPKATLHPRHLLRSLAADCYELCALWFLMRSADGSPSTSSGGLFPSPSPLPRAPGRGAILATCGAVGQPLSRDSKLLLPL